jgi:hypothetical protein
MHAFICMYVCMFVYVYVFVRRSSCRYVYKWKSIIIYFLFLRIILYGGQVFEFVRVFMPAYIKYLPHLYLHGPQRKADASVLKVMDSTSVMINSIF